MASKISDVLGYSQPLRMTPGRALTAVIGATGLIIGFIATIVPLIPLWFFWQIPIGSRLRPMNLEMLMCMCAAVSILAAMPLSCWCYFRSRTSGSGVRLAVAGLLMSAIGTVAGFALYATIISLRRFVIEG